MQESIGTIVGAPKKWENDNLDQNYQYSKNGGLAYGSFHGPSKTIQGDCLFTGRDEKSYLSIFHHDKPTDLTLVLDHELCTTLSQLNKHSVEIKSNFSGYYPG